MALTLALAGTACGSSSSRAGDGFGIDGADLIATSTTTTAAAPDPALTQVATAAVPKLEVYTDKPTGAVQAQPASLRTPSVASAAPIPREGLNSAGSAKTDFGFVFDNPTYFGKPLVLVATGRDGDWIKVLLPARPNGQEGWVRASDVTLSQHAFHGLLDLSDRQLTFWEGGTEIAATQVVVGASNSPTPEGHIYIAEILTASEGGTSPGGAYGPNILATNAYSETLDLFQSGLPVIAFHGTNQPGLIGSAVSNGCIRMPNDVVALLADTLPPGTPVDIVE